MITAVDCRAKAHLAFESAKQAPDDETRLHWEEIADHWLALARMGEAQEAVGGGLSDAGRPDVLSDAPEDGRPPPRQF
jgi:hypothetical protein